MHYYEVNDDTASDFCFICNRATEHIGEHEEQITCPGPTECIRCAAEYQRRNQNPVAFPHTFRNGRVLRPS